MQQNVQETKFEPAEIILDLLIYEAKKHSKLAKSLKVRDVPFTTTDLAIWQRYLNKGECNLNQSKDDSFVERVAKNNSSNNGDRHKIYEIFLINCFAFVITLV